MVNGVCPDYLSDLLPPLVSTRNPYHRCRPLERVIQPHKTDIYQKSFIPSTIMLWNSIPENIKQVPLLANSNDICLFLIPPFPLTTIKENEKSK